MPSLEFDLSGYGPEGIQEETTLRLLLEARESIRRTPEGRPVVPGQGLLVLLALCEQGRAQSLLNSAWDLSRFRAELKKASEVASRRFRNKARAEELLRELESMALRMAVLEEKARDAEDRAKRAALDVARMKEALEDSKASETEWLEAGEASGYKRGYAEGEASGLSQGMATAAAADYRRGYEAGYEAGKAPSPPEKKKDGYQRPSRYSKRERRRNQRRR